MPPTIKLDIIGDIHGQLEALLRLGRTLGYDVDNSWRHPDDRKLIFVGDLIDRGPHSLEVAQLVRSLCIHGDAFCLMGNHEFNIVEWRHGRTGAKSSNRATIEDIKQRPDPWARVLDFFESLALALEFRDLRVTHAVWHKDCVAELEPAICRPSPSHNVPKFWAPFVKLHSPYDGGQLRPGISLDPSIDRVHGPHHANALEIVLKGHEVAVREPFMDNDGKRRDKVRAQWWKADHLEVPKDRRIIYGHYWNMPPIVDGEPTFVPPHPSGHPNLRAWFNTHISSIPATGEVAVPGSERAVCIDYSGAVKSIGGKPCVGAYRYPEAKVTWSMTPD